MWPPLVVGCRKSDLTHRIFIPRRSYRRRHSLRHTHAVPPLFAPASNENIAPELQIQKPPNTICGVFKAGTMTVDERLHFVDVEVRCQQSVARAKRRVQRLGTLVEQPLTQWRWEAHFFAVSDLARQQIL